MRLTNASGTVIRAEGELATSLLSRGWRDADEKTEEKPKRAPRKRTPASKSE